MPCKGIYHIHFHCPLAKMLTSTILEQYLFCVCFFFEDWLGCIAIKVLNTSLENLLFLASCLRTPSSLWRQILLILLLYGMGGVNVPLLICNDG